MCCIITVGIIFGCLICGAIVGIYIYNAAHAINDYVRYATLDMMTMLENATSTMFPANENDSTFIQIAKRLESAISAMDKAERAILQAADRTGTRDIIVEYHRRERALYIEYVRLLRETRLMIQMESDYMAYLRDDIVKEIFVPLIRSGDDIVTVRRVEAKSNSLVMYTNTELARYDAYDLQYESAIHTTLGVELFLKETLAEVEAVGDDNSVGWTSQRRVLTYGVALVVCYMPSLLLGLPVLGVPVVGLAVPAIYDAFDNFAVRPLTAESAHILMERLKMEEDDLLHNKRAFEYRHTLFMYAKVSLESAASAITSLHDIVVAGYVPKDKQPVLLSREHLGLDLKERIDALDRTIGEHRRRLQIYLDPLKEGAFLGTISQTDSVTTQALKDASPKHPSTEDRTNDVEL